MERYFELGTFRKHPNVRTKSTQLERDNYKATGFRDSERGPRAGREPTSANRTVYKNVTQHTGRKLLRRPERSPAGHDAVTNFLPASRLLCPVPIVGIIGVEQAGSLLHLGYDQATLDPVPVFGTDHV